MRIRSIKPEFWRDAKIASLKNKLAGYFFIALWNIADDEGKFEMDPKGLSLQAPIFRTKDILTYISELSHCGLIMVSECSQWGLITNWNHQKIDRPRLPKVKKEEIQWVTGTNSTKGIESSSNVRRKDRIGKDRIYIEPASKVSFATGCDDASNEEKTKSSWLVELWNEHCGPLPKVIKETPSRRKRINSRLAAEPDRDKWLLCIKKIVASDFCCGKSEQKNGSKPWVANFDWLIRSDDTIIKVLEGLYDNKINKKPTTLVRVVADDGWPK